MSPRVSASQRDEYMLARRAQILDAALDIFSRKGYSDAGVDEIASAAGIAKGTIYLHFESKDQIVQALLEERSFVLALADLISEEDTVEGTLRKVAEGYFHFIHANLPIVRMVIINYIQYPENARTIFHETVHKGIQMLADFLEERAAAGQIRPLRDPYLTARTFLGLLMAQFFMQDVMGGRHFAPVAEDAWIDECVRLFRQSIALTAIREEDSRAPEREKF